MARLKRKKQMKPNKGIIKTSVLKIIVFLIIIGLNWAGISAVIETIAYFNDTEASSNNAFIATDLDFSLDFFMSDGFRTQTQGGWGAGAKGDNPGVYRDANFDNAFPSGLTIGGETPEHYAHFTSSISIENFLPAKGTPAPFSGTHEDPLETEAGILAGQAVALTLNIGFDDNDSDFSVNQGKLKDFYANDSGSPCEDMTVSEVLTEANNILAGQSSVFSPSAINECLTEINEKFVDGLTQKITPYKSVWREITIIKEGSLSFQHNIKIEQISGDTDLYQTLTLNAYLNGVPAYSGNLLNFVHTPTIFSNSTNEWKLYIGLPLNASLSLRNKTCGFKYTITGWQENISLFGGGFSDVEEVFDSVDSGNWGSPIVLNEFLPNPNGLVPNYGFNFGEDDSLMPQGEWIELYNNGDVSYDLNSWYVWDASGDDLNKVLITSSNTYPASTIISAKSWLVVYMNKMVLDNTGDTVKLFDNYDNLIDIYTYTIENNACDLEPTLGQENDSTEIGICNTVPPNKSYARIPDGIGDWVDPVPTPGWSNLLNIEEKTEELEPGSTNIEISTAQEELIIIDGLFLASPPQNFLDFQSDQESTSTEEIIINQATSTDFEQEATTTQEIITTEILTETFEQATEDIIEEIPIVIDEPIIEEITDELVDQAIIDVVEEPEPEQIEEVPALLEPELTIINEKENNSENGDE